MSLRVLYGPTAGGKSALALDWALKHQGTIVNADSLQVYDALPILTAQPDKSELAQAPHKLYGFADPQTPMNAAQWAALAAAEIARHENCILVGGTGMYIATLLDGIAPIPSVSAETRQEVTEMYDRLGPDAFHEALETIDPEAARKTHPNRREQMIRAREVYEATGTPFSEWRERPKQQFLPPETTHKLVLFMPDKAVLKERAAKRFDQMLSKGALQEAQDFAAKYGTEAPACKALGFHALLAHAKGDITMDEAKTRVIHDTNDYIKRQLTWGRGQFSKRESAITCATDRDAATALA